MAAIKRMTSASILQTNNLFLLFNHLVNHTRTTNSLVHFVFRLKTFKKTRKTTIAYSNRKSNGLVWFDRLSYVLPFVVRMCMPYDYFFQFSCTKRIFSSVFMRLKKKRHDHVHLDVHVKIHCAQMCWQFMWQNSAALLSNKNPKSLDLRVQMQVSKNHCGITSQRMY